MNARRADGLDLRSQIKVARWNIKGPQFAALPPLEAFAVSLANFNDAVAERAVTQGARAYGTVRHAAKASRLPEYPQDTTRDIEHVKLLADRIETYLVACANRAGSRSSSTTPTVDLMTQIITQFEKNGWHPGRRGDPVCDVDAGSVPRAESSSDRMGQRQNFHVRMPQAGCLARAGSRRFGEPLASARRDPIATA